MKLYVVQNNQKRYLNLTANTRRSLANKIGGEIFFLGDTKYSVYDVRAEKEGGSAATGAVVGGVVGALGGPIGILIGGAIGGLFGNSSDEDDALKVNKFNASHL